MIWTLTIISVVCKISLPGNATARIRCAHGLPVVIFAQCLLVALLFKNYQRASYNHKRGWWVVLSMDLAAHPHSLSCSLSCS